MAARPRGPLGPRVTTYASATPHHLGDHSRVYACRTLHRLLGMLDLRSHTRGRTEAASSGWSRTSSHTVGVNCSRVIRRRTGTSRPHTGGGGRLAVSVVGVP